MGLCKCPRRKVSTLFCFEHRVNVCDSCLVSDHSRCVVQTYLQWLQDSDYNPNCSICNVLLSEKETIRFLCLHLFHYICVDNLFSQLPPNTAPNGYKCYACRECVFFTSNVKSPLADDLRQKFKHLELSKFSFDIDLLLLDKESTKEKSSEYPITNISKSQNFVANLCQIAQSNDERKRVDQSSNNGLSFSENPSTSKSIHVECVQTEELKGKHSFQKNTAKDNFTRKLILVGKQIAFNVGIGRHGRTRISPYMVGTRSRKILLFVLFFCLCTLFFVIIRYHNLSHLSSQSGIDSLNDNWDNYDPMLNPANNPMIKIRRN